MKSAEVRRELDCPYLGLGRKNIAVAVATPVFDSNENERGKWAELEIYVLLTYTTCTGIYVVCRLYQ